MTLKKNGGDDGSNGTTVTTGNSGGTVDNVFSAVSIGAGSALTFDNATVAHGLLSYKFVMISGITTTVSWTYSSPTTIVLRFYVMFDTLPSATLRLVDVRNSGGTILRIQISAGNLFQVQEGGTGTPINMTTAAFQAGVWYRWEMEISVIAAGTGAYKADYYYGDSAQSIQGVTRTTGQLGTTAITLVTFCGNAAANHTVHFDDMAVNDGSTVYLGPVRPQLRQLAMAGVGS